jgi:hypothetical protein
VTSGFSEIDIPLSFLRNVSREIKGNYWDMFMVRLSDIPQYFPLIPKVCRLGLEFKRWTSDKPGKMGIVSFSQHGH